jgi:hypothetical protein
MRKVIPLRYGTAFKKAFRKPHIYSAFVRDILDIEFEAKEVFEEYAFHPPVGRVNIRYDLFAEDPARRVVVEMQHIRDDETLDRFLYYHLIGQVEQVQGVGYLPIPAEGVHGGGAHAAADEGRAEV